MSPLFETIRLKDGLLFNLRFHNRRLNDSRRSYFGVSQEIRLEDFIQIPDDKKNGLYRCRVTYSPGIEKTEFIRHEYRAVKSLKLVEGNTVDYRFKYSARGQLEKLFVQRGNCDDILIVKNGCISDSFTANAVFFDGEKWWTPDTPLLSGTQRARLLEEKKIFECRITPACLPKYQKAGLINAMWNLEEMPVVEISDIFYE